MSRLRALILTSLLTLACFASVTFAGTPNAGTVIARVPIAPGTGGFAVGEGAVWTVSDAGPTLYRIDAAKNKVASRTTIQLDLPCPASPPGCGEIAAGNGAIWLSHPNDNTVSRFDPRANRIVATIHVPNQPEAVATAPGAVWVAGRGGPTISRIDPRSNRVVATIRVGRASICCSDHMAVTASPGAVWATVANENTLVRINPATNRVDAKTHLTTQPCGFLVADSRTLWAAGAHCGSAVSKLDVKNAKPIGTVTGSRSPIGLALAFGSLWLADLDARSVERVDPGSGRIVSRMRVGGIPVRLGVGFGSIWVRDDSGRVLRIKP
jgi:streptogramin lyase